MYEIDVEGRELAPGAPSDAVVREALQLVFASAGVPAGHVAIHFVDEDRSHELAAIGRRVCENEHDLFLALEGRW